MIKEAIVKPVFVVLNVLCFIIGSVLLGIGAWMYVDPKSFIKFIGSFIDSSTFENIVNDKNANKTLEAFLEGSHIRIISYALIPFGAILFVISFCGCYGALKESKFLLFAYSFLMVILVISQVGVFVCIMEGKFLVAEVKGILKKSISDEYIESNPIEGINIWDVINVKFQCCGVENYEDFKGKPRYIIPLSCCKMSSTNLETNLAKLRTGSFTGDNEFDRCREDIKKDKLPNDRSNMNTGCYDKLNMKLRDEYFNWTVGILVAVVVFETLVIVFAGFIKVTVR